MAVFRELIFFLFEGSLALSLNSLGVSQPLFSAATSLFMYQCRYSSGYCLLSTLGLELQFRGMHGMLLLQQMHPGIRDSFPQPLADQAVDCKQSLIRFYLQLIHFFQSK